MLGEGPGVLVLESEASARRRGREILAEVLGYGASADGHHLTQPTPDGPARATHRALLAAGLQPGETVALRPGQRQRIAAGRIHRVVNRTGTPARDLLVQATGPYDFVEVED